VCEGGDAGFGVAVLNAGFWGDAIMPFGFKLLLVAWWLVPLIWGFGKPLILSVDRLTGGGLFARRIWY
jgi:hypothetical protein